MKMGAFFEVVKNACRAKLGLSSVTVPSRGRWLVFSHVVGR